MTAWDRADNGDILSASTPASRDSLLRLELSMTVIAALRETSDAILFSADTGGMEQPGGIRVRLGTKLRKHPEAPLIWAAAGNPTIGDDFTNWLTRYSWPPPDWATFRDQAIDYLSRLNRRQRELIQLAAKGPPSASDTTVILLAGWLNDELDLLELGDDGKAISYAADGFHAVGGGKVPAYVAHRVLDTLKESPEMKLRRICE